MRCFIVKVIFHWWLLSFIYWLSNSKVFFKLDSSCDFICNRLNIIIISHNCSIDVDFNSVVVRNLIRRNNTSFLIWHEQFRSFFSNDVWISRINVSSSSFERRWNDISGFFRRSSYCVFCWIPRVFDWLNDWFHFVFQCCEFWNHIIDELLTSIFDVRSCFSECRSQHCIKTCHSLICDSIYCFSVSREKCDPEFKSLFDSFSHCVRNSNNSVFDFVSCILESVSKSNKFVCDPVKRSSKQIFSNFRHCISYSRPKLLNSFSRSFKISREQFHQNINILKESFNKSAYYVNCSSKNVFDWFSHNS